MVRGNIVGGMVPLCLLGTGSSGDSGSVHDPFLSNVRVRTVDNECSNPLILPVRVAISALTAAVKVAISALAAAVKVAISAVTLSLNALTVSMRIDCRGKSGHICRRLRCRRLTQTLW